MTFTACIFILTQNTIERKVYLKSTLYFLFKNYNSIYKHPVVILHEGDYDEKSKEEILLGIRQNYRNFVSFKELDKNDFQIPEHIDKTKLELAVNSNPVPYWRTIKYRLMCYFWIKNFIKYCDKYDYCMRLDDDAFIEEPIKNDFFEIMEKSNSNYISNILHIDCGICNYGMKELFNEIDSEANIKLKDFFIDNKLPNGNIHFENFKKVYKIVEGKNYDKDYFDTPMPVMYYNNFFVMRTSFWKSIEIQNAIEKIDKNGGIFYYRYGDAPIQSLLMVLYCPDKISRCIFKYSKKLQRECFIDSNKNFHSYMPTEYTHSSCISNNK